MIRNRLSFKNLFEHISETFFNYDNKLLRTFIDLLKRPEEVIDGYIKGIRKRYVNPISYLGIALTLLGITFFIMKKINFEFDVDVFNQGINDEAKSKVTNFTSEYNSFFLLSYIPMFVVSSWLILKQNINYNFTERTVVFIYAIAEISLVLFLPSLFAILIFPENYTTYSFLSMVFLGSYIIWLLFRISNIKGLEFWGHLFVFFFVFGFIFICFSIGMAILGFLTGELNIKDFVPKN